MTKTQNTKRYDLEDRTLEYAKRVRNYIHELPKSITNFEYSKQLVRSSNSVGANYIEANESLSKKDFLHRIRICRKEAKESSFHLALTEPTNAQKSEQTFLIQGSHEFVKIFSSILQNSI